MISQSNGAEDARAAQQDAQAEDIRRALFQAMAQQLDPPEYQAFVLCCLEDMTQSEAADALNLSPAVICRRVNSARNKLRNFLGYHDAKP
ncbi:MAG: sigma-70 family RNA polymerase sigma factor [Butyricicoccaceae bacterium]